MRLNLSFCYRKKKYDSHSVEATNLNRVLNLLDLTALGVASTLGPGVYVLIGNIIAKQTGPSIILAFLLAGVSSLLSGLCYAELGARVPRSGSAYAYIYATIGEFLAFFIGWDVLLEYIIGTSAGASALSQYIDALSDFKISAAFRASMPMNLPGFAKYPDFLAFGILLVVIFLLILGVKDSSLLNIVFTGGNLAVVVFIILVGTIGSDPNNWTLDVYPNLSYIDMDGLNTTCAQSNRCGSGGFFPFGAEGLIRGTAKCFYAYIGFDVIATTGEEVLDPKRTIPLSVLLTLFIVSLCYVLVSTTVSLMLPYYVYDPVKPLSEAFRYIGLDWASYVISVGAIISLITSIYAGMFPMPRVLYSMASDGVIFRKLDYVMPKLKTPLLACLVTGLISALLVLLLDLNQLVDMMSFGTLLAYSVVSMSTLVLRYTPHTPGPNEAHSNGYVAAAPEESEVVKETWIGHVFGHSNEPLWKRIIIPSITQPSKASSRLVNTMISLNVCVILIICLIVNVGNMQLAVTFAFFMLFLVLFFVLTFLIWIQPQDDQITTFKVPFVPFLPLISTFFSLFLLTAMNGATWLRYTIWFIIGFVVYFTYGIRNSNENKDANSHQFYFFPCLERDYATTIETDRENVISVMSNGSLDNESIL